jgi:quercetin dioxygenase-like cupin family protein
MEPFRYAFQFAPLIADHRIACNGQKRREQRREAKRFSAAGIWRESAVDMSRTCERRDFLVGAGGFAAFTLFGALGEAQGRSPQPARRVVTGVNVGGKSAVVSDGPVPEAARFSTPGEASGCDLWMEKSVPADIQDQIDPMADYSVQAWPPPGGVTARTITWQPGFSYPMHRSDTIDILFVISGELELILEDGSTVLKPGDCVVQRGTNHAWRVVGEQPCTFAGVLISAVPR